MRCYTPVHVISAFDCCTGPDPILFRWPSRRCRNRNALTWSFPACPAMSSTSLNQRFDTEVPQLDRLWIFSSLLPKTSMIFQTSRTLRKYCRIFGITSAINSRRIRFPLILSYQNGGASLVQGKIRASRESAVEHYRSDFIDKLRLAMFTRI